MAIPQPPLSQHRACCHFLLSGRSLADTSWHDFHVPSHSKHLRAYFWIEDPRRGFVLTHFFRLEACSNVCTMKMENVPKSRSPFQKDSEPWWPLIDSSVGSAASPRNRRCQGRPRGTSSGGPAAEGCRRVTPARPHASFHPIWERIPHDPSMSRGRCLVRPRPP